MQNRETVTGRLRRRGATGVYKAYSVPLGFAIIVLNTLGSSIRLGVVIDSVSRLVIVEVVTSFLIRAVVGIT